MASWYGNRTVAIFRSRRDAELEAKRLNAVESGGWNYVPRQYGDGRRGWWRIQARDEAGRVLGDI